MPLALDPDRRFAIVLETDEEKPKGKQPTFYCRFLSGRDWKTLGALSDRLEKLSEGDVDALLEEIESCLALALVDWTNMIDPATGKDIRYSPKEIDRVVNVGELMELLQKILARTSVDITDRKKVVLPSRKGSGRSARSASQAGPAGTHPRKKRRSS